MKKIIIISLLCFYCIQSYSQLLEDKTNLYIGYQRGLYLGNEQFNSQGTIAPSFYSNLLSNNGIVLKDIINLSPLFSAGIKLGFLASTNWENNNYISYKGAKSSTINLQPIIQIHNQFEKSGLNNRLKMYAEILPVIGLSMINIKNNLFDISNPEFHTGTFTSSTLIYGLEASIGCEYAFTNKIGAYINLSLQEGFINTPLFLDNRYTLLGFNVGARLNISKVKRYNY